MLQMLYLACQCCHGKIDTTTIFMTLLIMTILMTLNAGELLITTLLITDFTYK
jgi:hypothetical protein